MASLARENGIPPFHWKMCEFDKAYPLGAAAVWGIVMALFEACPHVLHPSLKRSMDEIYRFQLGPTITCKIDRAEYVDSEKDG